MKKCLITLLVLTFFIESISFGSEISEQEKVKNKILSLACFVSAIELAFFVQDTSKPHEGDRILNQSFDSSGNFTSLKLFKTNGFVCDYSPFGIRTECVRNDEKFVLQDDILKSGKDPLQLVFEAMESKDGGFMPSASIKNLHRGATYTKQGNIMKVVVMDYSLTINCNSVNIIDSKLPSTSRVKQPLINVITDSKFVTKLNLFYGGSISPQMPFTDLGDILKMLIDHYTSPKNKGKSLTRP